ncbi:acetyl-CoA synthetase-like protein [Aspergillus uvarum CBS 121591]|uniref:Acetyl-CoA synthetase-like protein n=1 Tax=Aspergillus uvarum CBS 121591 TaxID=1448315 RepID=A0A319CDZ6_9EURO|nr:acetyl-CoA synthetase-like protein [Aspergillus uvarum CBS 121591]PYH82680.1 acetyl-CoA synthetase-like protein [Aspergillus uvarum CBS 121591]
MTTENSALRSPENGTETRVLIDVPRVTTHEEEFQNICAEVLSIEVDRLDVSQSFIGLGGDSIAAINLIARCEERGMEVQTGAIINATNISELFSTVKVRPSRDDARPASLMLTRTSRLEEAESEPFSLWPDYSRAGPEEQPRLLEQVATQCGIEVDMIEDVYVCTPLQEGLMAITARKPAAYVDRRAFTLAPTIDLDRFQAAWETLIAKTAILRTRICMGPSGRALQVVSRNHIPWQHGTTLRSYLAEDRKEGMQLGQPLARWGLIPRSNNTNGEGAIFVWTAHHSVYDGWSAMLLYRRLAAIYFHNQLPPSTPYTRFVRYVEGKDPILAANYWHDQLRGDNLMAHWPALPTPNYQPSPRTQFKGEILMRDAAEQGVVMVSHILRAAWALVLAQYTGQDDIIFAATLSGRNAPVSQVAEIAAPLITTVPVRIRIDRSQTVGAFLQAVQRHATDMIEYEHTGLQTIKSMLPELSGVLTLQNLLIVQPASERDVYQAFPGLSPVQLPLEDFDSYAVNVECTLGRQAVAVEVMYDDEVIAPADLTKVMDQFSLLVQELSRSSARDQLLQEALGISSSDRQQLLEWNATVPASVDRCIHDLVADQVRVRPTALAVDAWDGQWQYADLTSQSIALAHYLVSLGVGPEQTVGLCMSKSKWAVVTMLAILQAGAAVLPLSVRSPLARLQSIVQDASPLVIIVDQDQEDRLDDDEFKTLVVDATLMASLTPQPEAPHTGVTPQNPAWVVYTSGSTGTPKGVVLEHRSLYQYTRTLQFAAYTFDAGGCVCVPSEEQRMNALAATAARMEPTLVPHR